VTGANASNHSPDFDVRRDADRLRRPLAGLKRSMPLIIVRSRTPSAALALTHRSHDRFRLLKRLNQYVGSQNVGTLS
jgi:hypothetical protein